MAHNLRTSVMGVVTRFIHFIRNIPRRLQGPAEKIQLRLSDDLERCRNEPKALRLIREMYEACLVFSIQIVPLTRTGSCREPGLLLGKRVDGVYQRVLEDALVRLKGTIHSLMDEHLQRTQYREATLEYKP